MRTILAVLVGLLSSTGALAASFPCAKASTATERRICAEPELSTLDDHMGQYYAGAGLALRETGRCLQSDQREWLRSKRDACADSACLKRAYLDRLAQLHALQPGASAIRYFELPKVSPLVWIIPPAEDKVAAPTETSRKSLVIRGNILNEVSPGDGFIIRTNSGTKHNLLSLMFLSEPSSGMLAGLARQTGTLYEARGIQEKGASSPPHFSAGACTYIYQVTP